MLEPQDRRLLLEALRPPVGYELDCAVGTTFSLELHALLTVPLAFTFFDWEDDQGKPENDPLALLEAVRRNAKRIGIFCQAGQIHVPKRQERLFGYLEDSVCEVTTPKGGVFHPKIWLLRYESESGPVLYRLLCSSRNLTFDRSWDTMLVLEGQLVDRKNAFSSNHPLGDFINELPALASTPVPEFIDQSIHTMQDEIRRVDFELPPGFEEISFWPCGIRRYSRLPFDNNRRRMLVMAPFLSDSFLQKLIDKRKECVLVTRLDTAEELENKTIEMFDKVYVLNQDADPEETGEEENQSEKIAPLSGLHAKLFVMNDGWKSRIWTGSANASQAAFKTNVEFMVELKGSVYKFGIDKLLEQANGNTNFSDLLLEFTPSEERAETNPLQKELEDCLEEAKRLLINLDLTAEVSPDENGKEFSLKITTQTSNELELSDDVTIVCWPVTLPANSAVMFDPMSPEAADFGKVSLDAITAFFAFELECKRGGQKLASRFVLKINLNGEPPQRFEHLLRSLLKNKSQVLRLMLLILADQSLPSSDMNELRRALEGSKQSSGQEMADIPLLETLLRALDRDPEKLDRLKRLIDDLSQTPEGISLLPDGLDMVWPALWKSRERLRK